MKKQFYGIDFGTTNTVVSFIDDNENVRIVPIDEKSQNQFVLRSVIYFSKDSDISFGQDAVNRYNQDVSMQKAAKEKVIRTGNLIKVSSDATATSGFKPDKIVEQVFETEVTNTGRLLQSIKSLLANNTLSEINIFGKAYTIEKLIGIFLKEVKARADKFTGSNVKKVVLGRPVNFVGKDNKTAEKRLIKAAKLAGFTEVLLQLEPIGAAYDYGINTKSKHTALIFDFGGGTLDLSIIQFPEMKVLVNKGIPLGGDLINTQIFSEKIARHFGRGETYGINSLNIPESLYQKLQHWYAISLLKTERFNQSIDEFSYNSSDLKKIENLKNLVFQNLGFSLYENIDLTKKLLSVKKKADFKMDLTDPNIHENIKRKSFEKLIASDLKEISILMDESLVEAKLKYSDIDSLVLTGGSSLIPAVRKLLEKSFGEKKLNIRDTFTSVASGLALYADTQFA